MRPMPIVMVNPQRELLFDVRCPWVGDCPEFLQHRPLNAFDLAVQMWRSWTNGTEPDGLRHQAALHGFGKELRASVRLQTLDRKWHLFQNPVQKSECPGGQPALRQTGRQKTTAIVDCGELVEAGPYLAGVHLDPIPWYRSVVAFGLVANSLAWGQNADTVPYLYLVDGRRGKLEFIEADQLVPDTFNAETPIAPQFQDAGLLSLALLGRRMMGTATTLQETGVAFGFIAPEPFPQRRPGDAIAAANSARVADDLPGLYPTQPPACRIIPRRGPHR